MAGPTAPEVDKISRRPELASLFREKREPTLGQLNPLIHPLNLSSPEMIEAFRSVTRDKIAQYGGIEPVRFESVLVTSLGTYNPPSELRMFVKFETDHLSPLQLSHLEQLVKRMYGIGVKTTTNFDGSHVPTITYPPTEKPDDSKRPVTLGWYMGPNTAALDNLHTGLLVFKDLGVVNRDNFLSQETTYSKYIVEVREAAMYQTDLVEFITQVATILGQKKPIDQSELLYGVYYDLIRRGLKDASSRKVYGMREALGRIRRGLILPLANVGLSHGIDQHPESVLLAGVPGTGKTLLGEHLLQMDTGLIIAPLDSAELARELAKDPSKQYLLARISQVYQNTGIPVVLHVDDIEDLAKEEKDSNSTPNSPLINLMAGIRESGFYVVASTNHPEKIAPSLLQPQRFGILIHCGLPDSKARLGILDIHTPFTTKKLEVQLFASMAERMEILADMAKRTSGYTARYLEEIATVAKAYLHERVSERIGKSVGMDEGDLDGEVFSFDDWHHAFRDVALGYDIKTVRDRDGEIREFIERHRKQMGLQYQADGNNGFFGSSNYQKMIAREAIEIGNT